MYLGKGQYHKGRAPDQTNMMLGLKSTGEIWLSYNTCTLQYTYMKVPIIKQQKQHIIIDMIGFV